MKLNIISAIGGTKFELEVDPTSKIEDVKKIISNEKRIPEDTFVLAFKGKQLDEKLTVKEAGIEERDKVYLIVRTEGG